MNFKFNFVLILAFFALISFNSCQDEVLEITETDEETLIAPSSTLANLMQSAVTNDGSIDDIMDDANCFSVNLPVTIIVNDITITINSLEDLALIEEIFDEYDTDEDFLEFLFPITIVLNDYEEIVIENEDQLEDFIEECTDFEDDAIECIDFKYPISFSIYNTDFQIIDTVVIENDEQLYEFLENLQDETDEVVLASLNFPVTMIYADGNTIEVNNNAELEAAINEAEDDCDEDEEEEDCSEEDVDEYLMECHWNIVSFNGDDNFIDNDIYFNEDGTLEIVNSETSVTATGHWSTSMSDLGVVLTLSDLTMFDGDLGGDWFVYDCDDDRLKFVREAGTTDSYIILERDCDEVTDCSVTDIQANLKECKWYLGSNLIDVNGPIVFTEDGAVKLDGEVIGGYMLSVYEGYVYLTMDLSGDYMNISKEWKVVECDEGWLHLINGDYNLVMEQDCEDDLPLSCLQANEIVKCDEGDDGYEDFNLYEGLSEIEGCSASGSVAVTFHPTYEDAVNNTNSISDALAYTNTSSPDSAFVRIENSIDSSEYDILEIELILEDCTTTETCTEEELDSYLMEAECHWVAVSVDGSNEYDDFALGFGDGNNLVIEGGGATFTGVWETAGNPTDGVYLVISQFEGNFEVFNDEWLVVECSEDRIVLTNNDIEIVIEKECP